MLSDSGNEIKKELEQLNQLKRKIRNLKFELQELLELGSIPKKSDYQMPSGKGGTPTSPQERYLLKVEELQEKINKTIDLAIYKEGEVLSGIENLDPLSHNLLMERYIIGKPLQKIIREFNYSESHIYRIYNNAFEKLKDEQNKR